MNFDQLKDLQEKPAPFAPGETLFWDDPHISAGMLAAHLDPTHDRASRRPEIVERSVAWLAETLGLGPGKAVIDLGCGPGLYASRLARRGVRVTGVDGSRRSIDYAVSRAAEEGLSITYRYENYLALSDREQYDAALLIYGDFCPLSPQERRDLLGNVYRALKPGGHFVLDVTTHIHRQRHGNRNRWYVADSGFWKQGPHLVLEEGFDYPDQSVFLDQAIVVEADGKVSIYRNWFQDYTREAITRELAEGGFTVKSTWSDLTGTPYTDETEWIGVVAQKR